MNVPLLRRRLTDSERLPVFALVSTVLVGLALVSLLLLPEQPAGDGTREHPARRQHSTAPAASRAPAPDRAGLVADARKFMVGYLDYLAGGADAQTIARVSFALRRLLTRHRPPRGHGKHRRDRLLDIQLGAVTDARASAVAAVVDESGATISIHLRLLHVSDGWEVSSLGR